MPNVTDSWRLASSYVDSFTIRLFATPLNFLKVLVLLKLVCCRYPSLAAALFSSKIPYGSILAFFSVLCGCLLRIVVVYGCSIFRNPIVETAGSQDGKGEVAFDVWSQLCGCRVSSVDLVKLVEHLERWEPGLLMLRASRGRRVGRLTWTILCMLRKKIISASGSDQLWEPDFLRLK